MKKVLSGMIAAVMNNMYVGICICVTKFKRIYKK